MPQASLVSTTNVSQVPNSTGGGCQVGASATSLVGFYGATPAAQGATGGAAVTTTASTSTSPFGYATSTQANAIVTLVNGIQAQLVALGLISS
jgi:UDP-N-acetyl-D-mannosaminuronic acid transferase (WecB/TagA/CpsF family)